MSPKPDDELMNMNTMVQGLSHLQLKHMQLFVRQQQLEDS